MDEKKNIICNECPHFLQEYEGWRGYHLCLNHNLGDPDGYEVPIDNYKDKIWIPPTWCPIRYGKE